jgi:hypothetical protein
MHRFKEGYFKPLYFILPLVVAIGLTASAVVAGVKVCDKLTIEACYLSGSGQSDTQAVLSSQESNQNYLVSDAGSTDQIGWSTSVNSVFQANPVSIKPATMNYGYSPGTGVVPETNPATKTLLASMGYSEDLLWTAGIRIIAYDGLIPKRCSANGSTFAYGMAVKSNLDYLKCSDGQEMISSEFKMPGKCTVIYNWKNFELGDTTTGNSKAVLAHEIGHCLHFIYGQSQGLLQEYEAIRPLISFQSLKVSEEIIANDFMICTQATNTSWGENSYYNLFDFDLPTADMCLEVNQVFSNFYPF